MAVTITGAPTIKPVGLTRPTREGGVFTASWKIPSSAVSESNAKRWQNVVVLWTITYNKKVKGEYVTSTVLKKLPATSTYNSTSLNPANLWPATGGAEKQVRSVSVRVRGWNSKGYGPNVDNTLNMDKPHNPSLTLGFDPDTGKVAYLLETTNVTGSHHRYDNVIWMKRQGVGGTSTLTSANVSTSTSRSRSFDISNASTLTAGQCIRITASARNRGMFGNGDMVTKNLFIAHPNAPKCGAPTLSYATRGVLSTASVIVPIGNSGYVKLKDGTYVWPTTVQLQRLKNSDSTNTTDASAEQGWEDVDGATDAGTCAGLTDTWADGVSDDGKRTWYRVAAMRDGYTQYGVPVFAKCIYVAAQAASVGKADVKSLTSRSNGTSAVVSWQRSGASSGGGIEISWSDDSAAWSSVSGPSTYMLTTDAASGTTYIDSLTEGTRYFVRVRNWNYQLDGTTLKYGNYSKQYSVVVESSTGTVTITSISAIASNAGVKVVLTKEDPSDAAELSWSDKLYAWSSNEEPETLTGSAGGMTNTLYVYGLEVGKTYYFRARSVDGTTYGAYSARSSFSLDESVSAVGTATITGATSGDDGETVVVSMTRSDTAYNLQLSWSQEEDAWESNEQPTTTDVSWAIGNTATAYVKGLEEGAPYHFRARCYSEGEYGQWSPVVTAVPYDAPHDVTASSPMSVAAGDPIPVSWTFDSESVQSGWQVIFDGDVVASGSDTSGAAVIPASRTSGLSDGSYAVSVKVRTGGGWAQSTERIVTVSQAPTGVMSVPTPLTAQPLTVSMTSTVSSYSVTVAVKADGCSEDDLRPAQPHGTTLWAGTFDGVSGSQYLVLPEGLDFRNGASYTVEASITDDASGLTTELASASLAVAWSHSALAPSATIDVSSTDMTAEVSVIAPTGATETDVCDVWRITSDGSYLIAQGRAFGDTVTDRYVPYTEDRSNASTAYRIVTRTVDGDVEFTDVAYELHDKRIRLDWDDDNSIMLKYAAAGTDSWGKNFAQTTHLDGSVSGRWANGSTRSSKLSATLVNAMDGEDQRLIRSLAQYAGPAFVRLPNGSAFMANVQVTPISWSAGSYVTTVGLDVSELTLSEEYMAEPVLEE